MNILILAQYYPPDIVGSGTRAANVANGLVKNGCNVTVIASFPHYPEGKIPLTYRNRILKIENEQGVKVIRVWMPALPHNNPANRVFLHLCYFFSSLLAMFLVKRVDVIWSANPNLFSIFPALIYSFIKHKPIVRNVDDLWPEVFYELNVVNNKVLKIILDGMAYFSYVVPKAITPISSGYKKWIIEKYNIPSDKIKVIEVGVQNMPDYSEKQRTQIFKVIYSGQLGQGYDFEIVLDSAKKIASINKNISFIIRGVGESYQKLKKKTDELNLKNLYLDNNYLSKNELNKLLDSADVFMLPMTTGNFIDKGLPTKIFEYQSHGRPIVCVSTGESARYIKSTNSGLVVLPNDSLAFSEAIMTIYQRPEVGSTYGRNGWLYVSENLTTEKIGKRFLSVFNQVLVRKGR